MTVTGLLTGQDILAALQQQDLGDAIILPTVMLKHGDRIFLDDMRVEELEDKLQTPIRIADGAEGLIRQCCLTVLADNLGRVG
jgi:NifB/MoaA-like Fe-S oxidoreductase